MSYSVLFLLITTPLLGLSANDTKLTKSIDRKYAVKSNVNLEIENKYGQIIINSWEKDSVVINIIVTAFGKNDSDTQKTLDRVEFDFNQVGNFLTIRTLFDRSSGSFKEFFNSIGDYSKSLLSKNKLQVDYEVFAPIKSNLEVQNKFGDLYISRHEGPVQLVMSHGDMKANTLTGSTSIELAFGNLSAKNLQNCELDLRASEADIKKTANLDLTSSSSEIEIDEAFSVKLDSRNDQISIDQLQVIQGSGVFTELHLGEVESLIDLDLSYGEVKTELVRSKFSRLQIESRSTDIDLTISDRSSFKARWIARDDNFSLDRVFNDFKREPHESRKGYTVITGNYGPDNGSEVTVKAQGGEVTINLSEENLSTLK